MGVFDRYEMGRLNSRIKELEDQLKRGVIGKHLQRIAELEARLSDYDRLVKEHDNAVKISKEFQEIFKAIEPGISGLESTVKFEMNKVFEAGLKQAKEFKELLEIATELAGALEAETRELRVMKELELHEGPLARSSLAINALVKFKERVKL